VPRSTLGLRSYRLRSVSTGASPIGAAIVSCTAHRSPCVGNGRIANHRDSIRTQNTMCTCGNGRRPPYFQHRYPPQWQLPHQVLTRKRLPRRPPCHHPPQSHLWFLQVQLLPRKPRPQRHPYQSHLHLHRRLQAISAQTTSISDSKTRRGRIALGSRRNPSSDAERTGMARSCETIVRSRAVFVKMVTMTMTTMTTTIAPTMLVFASETKTEWTAAGLVENGLRDATKYGRAKN